MKRNRTLIDVVTGIALCGILVAGVYSVTSDTFTSFNTPPANAEACSPDCATAGTTPAGPGDECRNVACQIWDGFNCVSSSVSPPCTWGNMCGADDKCHDVCEGFTNPDCASVASMNPGSGELCSIQCKQKEERVCNTPFVPTGACADEHHACIPDDDGDGEMRCLDPCEPFISTGMLACDDPSFAIPAGLGENCDTSCYTRGYASNYCYTTSTAPRTCSQDPIPLFCDRISTHTCVDPCEDFDEPFCTDVNPVRGLGEEERVLCKAYVSGTCNINMIGACAPGLIRDPAGTTCIENCAASPTGCSSSSSSSAPMCCNLTTQSCQPI